MRDRAPKATGEILLSTLLFADEHHLRSRRSFAEDGLRRVPAQRAAAALRCFAPHAAQGLALADMSARYSDMKARHRHRDMTPGRD